MVVIAQLLVSNLEAQLVSQQPAGKATKYETELGTLYEGVSIEKGAEISFGTSGNMEIIFGFMGLSSSNAFPVGADLRVFTAHSVTNKPQVTLVQDKATGKWLATNGRIALEKGNIGVVEGHKIKILGGQNDPIKIDGQPFAATIVVITNGKPVVQKKSP
jgi:hypothetical protein